MPFVEVNSINIYYEMHGSGMPLVVINGLSADISEFEKVTKPLTKNYRVLIFDNRGAGRSDKPDEPYSIAMMASDTRGVMRAAGLKKACILGISMGGRIAMELALTSPDMVDKLILVSTAPSRNPGKNWYRLLLFGILPRLPIFKGKYPQPYYAFARQRKASVTYNCTERLHALHVPTLIMNGRKDRIIPLESAEEMHTRIEDSKMVTFSGGHLFFLLRQDQFINTVKEFVG